MLISPSPMNILDYCNDFISGKIRVDTNYQRTDKVWPPQAKRYLIESILLGYPIPKFFLHQKIDAKSRTALKYIVDGQQRTMAIIEFFQNKISISKACKNLDIAGKSFDSLSDEYQDRFLSYSIPVDLFVTAQKEEIIETFRRINSYTVPLNSEEKRHANHQGDMKWFIHALATNFSNQLLEIGVFTDKNLARMADYKFYAEIILFLDKNKIVTTTAKPLDDLYAKYDKEFQNASVYLERLENAFTIAIGWEWLNGLQITATHIFQMLIASILFNEGKEFLSEEIIHLNLSSLSEALEQGFAATEHRDFLASASKTTNDGTRRTEICNILTSMIYK